MSTDPRAIRFYCDGHHTTNVKDHQKIGDLPNDFPRKGYFKNKLGVLREDRNTCDYDHSAYSSDLLNHHVESEKLLKDFLTEAKAYLNFRGLIVKGKI